MAAPLLKHGYSYNFLSLSYMIMPVSVLDKNPSWMKHIISTINLNMLYAWWVGGILII